MVAYVESKPLFDTTMHQHTGTLQLEWLGHGSTSPKVEPTNSMQCGKSIECHSETKPQNFHKLRLYYQSMTAYHSETSLLQYTLYNSFLAISLDMFTHTHIYIYTHTYNAYKNTCTHIHIYICMYVSMYVCIYIYMSSFGSTSAVSSTRWGRDSAATDRASRALQRPSNSGQAERRGLRSSPGPLTMSPPVRSSAEPGSDPVSVSCPCEMPSACQVLLRAVLLNNDATACYMNASALALLWSIHLTARPQLGRLAPLFQQLKAGSAVLLMRSMVWTMILGPWAQPNRQHDMHELLVHLMPRLKLPAVGGEWQFRRLEAAGVAICEQASTVSPITLDVPEEARGLQHCIQAWHSRHYRAALSGHAPALICLHLSRFRQRLGGAIVKDVQALADMLEVIRLPCFENSSELRVSWIPYEVCAAALHFGPTVHEGHYKALLRSGTKLWLTDDNQSAAPLVIEQLASLSANAYLIWCRLRGLEG